MVEHELSMRGYALQEQQNLRTMVAQASLGGQSSGSSGAAGPQLAAGIPVVALQTPGVPAVTLQTSGLPAVAPQPSPHAYLPQDPARLGTGPVLPTEHRLASASHLPVANPIQLPLAGADRRCPPDALHPGGQPPAAIATTTRSASASAPVSSAIPAPIPTPQYTFFNRPQPLWVPEFPNHPRNDDFFTQYHPFSTNPHRHERFEDYRRQHHENPSQIASFLRLFDHVKTNEDEITIKDYHTLEGYWNSGAAKLTKFEPETVKLVYKNEVREYTLQYRPLKDWAFDLVKDPLLAPFFEWDARKLFKYDKASNKWEHFINEPWTADKLWDFRSSLPKEGKPLPFIFYSDKTQLSSFGTVKAYPVFVRLANLPIVIRNGSEECLGGGRIVAWLPIVEETEEDTGTTAFANHKQELYHACLRVLFRSIAYASHHGYHVVCGDFIIRHLFPGILIVSADYEEQCIIALIRGVKGKCLCPVCLADIAKDTERRVDHALGLSATAANAYLADQSQCPVKSAFADLDRRGTDVFEALSWDRLHAYANGLGAKHIWTELLQFIKDNFDKSAWVELTRQQVLLIYSGLYHFNKVLSTKFQDGNKNEAMMKIAIFIAVNLVENQAVSESDSSGSEDESGPELDEGGDSEGNNAEADNSDDILDILASLENHTEDTLHQVTEALSVFQTQLEAYIEYEGPGGKNWVFPKAHTHCHMVRDILLKGATRNYNTKPNESMHRLLKSFYQHMTNFKNFDKTIGMMVKVTTLIRPTPPNHFPDTPGSNFEDDVTGSDKVTGSVVYEVTKTTKRRIKIKVSVEYDFGTILFGSPDGGRISIAKFASILSDDGLTSDMGTLLKTFVKNSPVPVVRINLNSSSTVFRFLRVLYESKVTWESQTDILQCTKQWYKKGARRDSVMVDVEGVPEFGRLLSLFTLEVQESWPGQAHTPLALVKLYDHPVSNEERATDKRLGLHRGPPKSIDSLWYPEHLNAISSFLLALAMSCSCAHEGPGVPVPFFGANARRAMLIDANEDMYANNEPDPPEMQAPPAPALQAPPEPAEQRPFNPLLALMQLTILATTQDILTGRADFSTTLTKAQATISSLEGFIKSLQLEYEAVKTQNRHLTVELALFRVDPSKENLKALLNPSQSAKKIRTSDDSTMLCRQLIFLRDLHLKASAFLHPLPPDNAEEHPDRFKSTERRRLGQTAELYEVLPVTSHTLLLTTPLFRDNMMSTYHDTRRIILNNIRAKVAYRVFNFLNPTPGIYDADQGNARAEHADFRAFIKPLPSTRNPTKNSLYRPSMFPECQQQTADQLLWCNWLGWLLRGTVFGPTSVPNPQTGKGGKIATNSTGHLWGLNALTPGFIAFSVVATIFIHSSNNNYAEIGPDSHINYATIYSFIKCYIMEKLREKDTFMGETIAFLSDIVFKDLKKKHGGLDARDNVEDAIMEGMADLSLRAHNSEANTNDDRAGGDHSSGHINANNSNFVLVNGTSNQTANDDDIDSNANASMDEHFDYIPKHRLSMDTLDQRPQLPAIPPPQALGPPPTPPQTLVLPPTPPQALGPPPTPLLHLPMQTLGAAVSNPTGPGAGGVGVAVMPPNHENDDSTNMNTGHLPALSKGKKRKAVKGAPPTHRSNRIGSFSQQE
ncbi:hypothetical protein FA15DRAFT_661341 [Coprinopsis marcescibilis]|uniref:Uncharacterized protein n=1 Tax=Coprinopsis marcescibilis TaxID=230819 RepID=A0A5C3KBZ1_COPMA|nr:hypothetical protein FA15DRAFT_661341 [Coprinopsis marcescibilis]